MTTLKIVAKLEVIVDWGTDTLSYENEKENFWTMLENREELRESGSFLFRMSGLGENLTSLRSLPPTLPLTPKNICINLAIRHINQGVGYVVGYIQQARNSSDGSDGANDNEDSSRTSSSSLSSSSSPPIPIGIIQQMKIGSAPINSPAKALKKYQVNVRFIHPNEGRPAWSVMTVKMVDCVIRMDGVIRRMDGVSKICLGEINGRDLENGRGNGDVRNGGVKAIEEIEATGATEKIEDINENNNYIDKNDESNEIRNDSNEIRLRD